MTFYTNMAVTARNMIRSKGQAMSLIRDSLTIAAPWGVDLAFPSTEVDGVEILRSDRKVVMEAGTDPRLSDILVIGSVPCAIISIKKLAPSGEVVIYTIQARAGG